ncbi:MAG: chorismate-binding protein, partial [Lentisphaeria bacterium]
MKNPSSQNGKEFARVYDRKQKCWLSFSEPVHIVEIYKTANLLPALEKIENACRTDKLFAVGFVAYDAAPAFDAAMQCRRAPDFPLLWFGLFPPPRKAKTLPLSIAAQTPPSFDYNWSPTVSENEYNAAIKRVKDYIEHGQTYQVNYSFRLRTRIDEQPEALFDRIISSQGFGYGAFLQTRQWTVCSASPELFFAKDDAHLKMRPMKGTASRGLTREDDLRNADWLRNSEKNRAENLMIVDMVRHDLGHIADPGSVKVDKIFEVEQYPTVWQMTSTVECRTTAGFADIFRALFPAASITGAPKIRTMEII